jgi:1-phosphatidylinositol-4-phosphate 5-kinase
MWLDGKPNGEGEKILINGNKYKGQWRDGAFEKGLCVFSDGRSYDGEWKDGKPFGSGCKKWKDGRRYEGYWQNGIPVGEGRKITPRGSEIKGYWDGDQFYEDEKYDEKVDAYEDIQKLKYNSLYDDEDEEQVSIFIKFTIIL